MAEDPGLQELAIDAYVAAHPEVTRREALRRIELQDRAAEARCAEVLPVLLGPSFAGLWFAAADHGRLHIACKTSSATPAGPEVDRARAFLADAGIAEDCVLRPARASLADLERERAQLRAHLEDLVDSGAITLGIDVTSNRVLIWTRPHPAGSVRSRLAAALDALGPSVPVTIEATNTGATKL